MADVRYDHLETLSAVLDEGTFEAAARKLNVTASAVSQRIKAMEQTAGRVLVQRTNPVVATEAGQHIVRYAQQVRLLGHDLDLALGDPHDAALTLPIAVNADSLATWFLPALAETQRSIGAVFDVYREDQEFTTSLLRSGTVVAAVTSERHPVQGCTSTPLGIMTYRAVATPQFRDRWLADTLDGLDTAPMVDFDRKDGLQRQFVRSLLGREASAPTHYVPTSADFARAVILGMGWGMLPDQQSADALASGHLVELAPQAAADVQLYWQRWNLLSTTLDELTRIVVAAAATALK